MGLWLHLFSMWPHLQHSSYVLSGPAFVYLPNWYHTLAALIPFMTKRCATLFPFTTKTNDDVAISPFCHLSILARSSLATLLGRGLLPLRPPLRTPLESSAVLLCLFPRTVQEALHGSSVIPWTDSLQGR